MPKNNINILQKRVANLSFSTIQHHDKPN